MPATVATKAEYFAGHGSRHPASSNGGKYDGYIQEQLEWGDYWWSFRE
ncbi:hypothetical protein [Desulfonatronum thioautotrophicum]|nr:hypothetical protein [Desulfonatronum thioautotrophicum]